MWGGFPCALCGATSCGLLCTGCHGDLPRLNRVCSLCGLATEVPVCAACRIKPPQWQHLVAPFAFAYPVSKVVHEFKYSGAVFWESFLAGEMVKRARALHVPLPEALMPVPIHPRRLAERGFNQALELARGISQETAISLLSGTLERIESRLPQVGLSAARRRNNVRGAFRIIPHQPVPSSVAIVDDILTTGATAHEIAKVLRKAGVKRLQVWVVARTQGLHLS